jgi:fibro-slime domain-containing protein
MLTPPRSNFPPRRIPLTHLLLASLLVALTACGGGDGGSAKPDGGSFPDDVDAGVDGGADAGGSSCGDRERQSGEACDDGNTQSGDGCTADCRTVEAGWSCDTPGQACIKVAGCGNGRVEAPEKCDDRNNISNDGCNADCTAVEPGWNCPQSGGLCRAAACGDRIIAGDEECEDGNTSNGDGCSSVCRLEPGWKCPAGQPCSRTTCGDGVVEGTEQCDDRNNDTGDGCSPLCTREPRCTNGTCQAVCGDGVILPNSTAEECDDGNTRANDGCSPTCRREEGFVCQVIKDAPPARVSIPVVYRDFRGYDLQASGGLPRGHIDFQNKNAGLETGIVAATLGTDGKPVYAKEGVASANTNGRAAFDQWYRDVANVNRTIVGTLDLDRQTNGSYVFDDQTFFPLDNAGWVASSQEPLRNDNSSPSVPRNFHFTSEARYWFEYKGTEVLTFRGDDDVWVFINRRLALDLGGVHGALSGTITLSQQASQLGLTQGGIYEVLVLQAERHTSASSYRLTLNNFETQRSVCTATCGNGTVDPGEECDDIANDGGYNQCARGCVWGPRCGDGAQQSQFGEECDDGNTRNGDGCSSVCGIEIG